MKHAQPPIMIAALLALALAVAPASAQTPDAARTGAAPSAAQAAAGADLLDPITPDDYGQWESLGFPTLSYDGEWIAYGISRVNDEDELRIRRIGTDSLIVIGYGSGPSFSEDGRYLAYGIGVSEEERERAQQQNRPVRQKLGLLDLQTGDSLIIADVASYAFSPDGGHLAMRRYPPQQQGEERDAADLVVRDLATGVDTRFGNVGEYSWQPEGDLLAMLISAADKAGNGVQLYDADTGTIRTLESDEAVYTDLEWRHGSDDLAVLRLREDSIYEDTTHVVLAWKGIEDGGTRYEFDPDEAADFPANTRVVSFRSLEWSEDGEILSFGVKERKAPPAPADDADEGTPEDSAEAESSDDDDAEPADVLVWHYSDVDIIPTQEVRSNQERRSNHLAVWHVEDGRFVQLGDERIENVTILNGDELAVGRDNTPYEQERMFGPVYSDIYLIDVESGERQRVIDRVQYFYSPSPGGEYLLYLENDHWFTYDIDDDRHTRITEGLATSFVDLDDDHTVEQKPPYGIGGWTEDDEHVLVYDKYDIWRIRPDGSDATRLTDGTADSLRYRYVDIADREPYEERWIDPDEPVYLSVYDDWAEANGYARMRMGDEPETLVFEEKGIGFLNKARDAEVYLYRSQDFDDSPDYFIGGPDLADAAQVTETNPFQSDYAWGRSELIEFENARGERLQGALFYPAGYEPGRQYPMITYIYEIRSPSARSYQTPSVESPYNTTVFTSEGYFVFQPDITYRDRNPGLSAMEAIVPAVETVLETGMIDPDRVGLVGHSWGGYQTTFAVTQTDIFRAAVAGAPLTNLVSMYSSIYWRTGGTDARIFEISQGRMEVPPWEDWDSYFDNSPLHNIENMSTPLLMGFGTDDGAVEFNQGVEFYNAARRAGKPLVMLVYDGENHGISSRESSRLDYAERVKIWFAHYLKGEPAPAWITEGVPYLDQIDERESGQRGANTTT